MIRKQIILGCTLAVLVFAGCKMDKEFDGPDLKDLYGKFTVVQDLDISNRSVDFSLNQTTFFTAAFSKNVQWNLQIKGLSSGAVKQITGFSSELIAENALWDGTTTSLPMFRIEDCAVQLTFENEVDTLRDTLSVVGNRINQGLLLSDFENGFPTGWTKFVQSGADMSFVVQENANAAQGNKYYDMGGKVDWDYLIGLFDIPASLYGAPRFNLNSNPEAVFFNSFIYKPDTIDNSIILFQFREDDNEDGTYSSNEDMYSFEYRPTENGWKQLSLNYADLQTLVNGAPTAAIGNGIHEPNKLLKVSLLFLANPTSGYSQSYIDYMIFTENAPLNP